MLATYLDRLAGGHLPYFDTFFEYPPLVGYVAGLVVRVTPGAAAYVAVWAVISAVAAGAVAWLLVRGCGTWRTLIFWSLSPQLLLYGAMNFDVLAVLFLVWASVLARADRRVASFAGLALGTLAKAFPALMVPLEVARLRGKGVTAALVTCIAIVIAVTIPSLLAPYPITLSALYVGSLTNFDSVWGIVLAALHAVGLPYAEAAVGVLGTAGMLVTYVYVLRRRPTDDPARLMLLGLLAVLLWTRLYSPQYSLWPIALFALAGIPRRTFALLAVADVIVFATVYPQTLIPWAAGDPVGTALYGALVVGILLRHAALLLAWRHLWPAGPRWHPVSA